MKNREKIVSHESNLSIDIAIFFVTTFFLQFKWFFPPIELKKVIFHCKSQECCENIIRKTVCSLKNKQKFESAIVRWLVIVFGPVLTPLLCRTQAVWWMSRFFVLCVFVADFVFYCDLGRSSFTLFAGVVVAWVCLSSRFASKRLLWCYVRWVFSLFFFVRWLLIAFKYCRTQSSCCLLSILCVLALPRCAQPRNLCALPVCFGVVVLSVGRWCTGARSLAFHQWGNVFCWSCCIFVNTFCVTIYTTTKKNCKIKEIKMHSSHFSCSDLDRNRARQHHRSTIHTRSHLVTLHKST